MASIIDVAKKAGVSIATVSRYINKNGYVGKESQRKIIEAIKELNFVPSELARSMLNKQTKLISMIVPGLYNPFFASIIHEVEQLLDAKGLKLMVANSSNSSGHEIEYLEMLKQKKVDGIIIISDNQIDNHLESEMPIVSFDRHFEKTPCISCDNYLGGRLAAKELHESGATKLLYFGDDAYAIEGKLATEVSKRKEGFVSYCDEHHLNYDLIEYPKNSEKRVKPSDIVQMNLYDGMFLISDFLATEILIEAKKQKVDVPGKLKVVGFDALETQTNNGLVITSIRQDPKAIAIGLMDTLTKRIKGESCGDLILPVTLRKGETT